ncbi:MAG TPA: oligopeptide/dipeptide ABC transporter ATP-binding protein [Bacilli bacterium]|nr:oligopeptide/dipeptide ABC transporter ATP-binding protein [Bacilli bacterium]
MKKDNVVLSVRDLAISFSTDHGRLQAVLGVDFDLYKGEVLAIVGESGSGKSVSAKTIMGILPNNGRIDAGEIIYEGEDLVTVSEEEFHRIRGKKIGMIFQDPLSSLNPIMRIGKQITEAIIINGDKLKLLYEDLIAPANIAYRNEQTRFRRIINDHKFVIQTQKTAAKLELEKLFEAYEFAVHQIREAAAKEGMAKEDIAKKISAEKAKYREQKQALKAKHREAAKKLHAEHRELVRNVNAEKAPILKELRAKLAVAKKEAKIEVKAHRAKLKENYNAEVAEILANTPEEEQKAAVKDAKSRYQEQIRITRARAREMALEVMYEVGIPQPERRYRQYPFEFSGGMRQRIVIAIALIQNPDVLICDEPTTALDVTIQAQILELILRLKRERQLSVIFITHDLGVVANMADRVAVMYAGKIVEFGNVEEIFYNPQHPYTWALLSSIPDVDSKERLEAIPGTPPNMVYPPIGDAFALRSKYAMAVDFKEEPPLFKVSETHYARTWLLDPRAPKVEMPKIVTERIRISLERAGKENE